MIRQEYAEKATLVSIKIDVEREAKTQRDFTRRREVDQCKNMHASTHNLILEMNSTFHLRP